jgi:hypothetical protein
MQDTHQAIYSSNEKMSSDYSKSAIEEVEEASFAVREDLGTTFKKFVERKWQDDLNVAAAEPQPWGLEREKATTSKAAAERAPQAHKATGVVNVVSHQSPPRSHSPTWETLNWRKC